MLRVPLAYCFFDIKVKIRVDSCENSTRRKAQKTARREGFDLRYARGKRRGFLPY